MHPEPTLSHDTKALPRRRVANLPLEPGALAFELRSLHVEPRESLGLSNADRSPPHDRQRDENKSGEHEGDPGSTPKRYAALRHARSLALRERGLEFLSASLAMTARLVRTSPSACPRQAHRGCLGGQMHDRLHSRIVCFARRSSPEW